MPDKDLKDALDATLKLQKDTQDSYAKAEVEVKKLGHVAAETKEKVEKLELAVDKLENARKLDELRRSTAPSSSAARQQAEASPRVKASTATSHARRPPRADRPGVRQLYKPAFAVRPRTRRRRRPARLDFRAALNVGSDSRAATRPRRHHRPRRVAIRDLAPAPPRQVPDRPRPDQLRRDLDQAVLGGWVADRLARRDRRPDARALRSHEAYAFADLPAGTTTRTWTSNWLVAARGPVPARRERRVLPGNGVASFLAASELHRGHAFQGTFERWRWDRARLGVRGRPQQADVPQAARRDEGGARRRRLLRDDPHDPVGRAAPERTERGVPGGHRAGPQGRPNHMGFLSTGRTCRSSGPTPWHRANWAEGYQIVDHASGMTVLRDPYTQKPHVGIYAKKRVGGDVATFEAIKLAKCST